LRQGSDSDQSGCCVKKEGRRRLKVKLRHCTALAHGAAWASVAHKTTRPKSSLDPHQSIVVFSPPRYSDLDIAAHIDQQGLSGHYSQLIALLEPWTRLGRCLPCLHLCSLHKSGCCQCTQTTFSRGERTTPCNYIVVPAAFDLATPSQSTPLLLYNQAA
jgi:hypothetical protein